jgi:hypothetical protein
MSVAMTLVSVTDQRDVMIVDLRDVMIVDLRDVMIPESVVDLRDVMIVDLRDVMIVETQWIQEDLLLLLSLVRQSDPLYLKRRLFLAVLHHLLQDSV